MIPRDGITPRVFPSHDASKPLGFKGTLSVRKNEWVETSPGVEVEQEVTKVISSFSNIGKFSDKQMAAMRATMAKREDEIFFKGCAS